MSQRLNNRVVWSDFSGGMNNARAPEEIGKNMSALIQGAIVHDGTIRLLPGKVELDSQHPLSNTIYFDGGEREIASLYCAYPGYSLKINGANDTELNKLLFATIEYEQSSNYKEAVLAEVSRWSGRVFPDWVPIYWCTWSSSEYGTLFGKDVYWDSIQNGIICLLEFGMPFIINKLWVKDGDGNTTCSCTHGSATVTFSGSVSSDWVGKRIFFKPSSGSGDWIVQYNIKIVNTSAKTITLDSNFSGATGTWIFTINNMQLLIPYSLTNDMQSGITLTAASSGSLGFGVYKYKFRFYSSDTTYSSALCDARSVGTPGSNSKVTIAFPTEMQNIGLEYYKVDKIDIYRTECNGTVYYYLGSVTRDWGGSPVWASYVDTLSDANLRTHNPELPIDRNKLKYTGDTASTMPKFDSIKVVNNRLYGIKGNQLYFSALSAYAYFYPYIIGIDDLQQDLVTDPTLGGILNMPQATQITAVIQDDASTTINELVGQFTPTMLIGTETGVYRLVGGTWDDFALSSPMFAPMPFPGTVVRCDNSVLWLSTRGIIKLTRTRLETISEGRLNLFDNESDAINPDLAKAQAIYWRNYYILAYAPQEGYGNRNVVLYHLPSDTFTIFVVPADSVSIKQWILAYGYYDNDALLALDGKGLTKVFEHSSNGSIWWNTEPYEFRWRSKAIVMDSVLETVEIKRVCICIKGVSPLPIGGQVTLSLAVYSNGSAIYTDTKTTSSGTTLPDERIWIDWYPQASGKLIQIELMGKPEYEFEIAWIVIEGIVHSDIRNAV